jgi:maltooligosyltrehalose trehalohydrolase
LSQGFVYQGEVSPHHGVPRGEPSAHLPPTAFVICLQNHDQIGNRAMGERLTVLSELPALRAATALLLLSPFIPMLFMGEEWGSKTPFLFFTSHNEELAKLVREGRRKEFQHFAAFQDEARRAQIPDPNDAATFAASIPDEREAQTPEHAKMLALTKHLLRLRRDHIMPGIPGCKTLGAQAMSQQSVAASWRLGTGATLTIASNFAPESVAWHTPSGTLLFGPENLTRDTLPAYTTSVFLDSPA